MSGLSYPAENHLLIRYNLGIETKALGFSAGFTGKEIERRMAEIGFTHDFISLPEGCSRINVKLKDFDGTENNGMGPDISPENVESLMQKLDTLTSEDYLVLAGSIPGSMPKMIYRDILRSISLPVKPAEKPSAFVSIPRL